MKTKLISTTALVLLPAAALFTLTSCSSTSNPPPAGSAVETYKKGVPGGAIVQTVKLTATVTAIDHAKRVATLLEPDGTKLTVKVGPKAINFDQVRVGDQVNATVEHKLVAYLDNEGSASGDGTAALVARAPKGAQPGGLVAESSQQTAEIIALDSVNHTATLRFDDGTTKTIPVRNDVDLGRLKVGGHILFRFTESVAIWVEKSR